MVKGWVDKPFISLYLMVKGLSTHPIPSHHSRPGPEASIGRNESGVKGLATLATVRERDRAARAYTSYLPVSDGSRRRPHELGTKGSGNENPLIEAVGP